MKRPAATPADVEATVTLRFAVFDDAPDLFLLAQLDSAEPLSEPILVAEVSGRLTAAGAGAAARERPVGEGWRRAPADVHTR
jgi:hypothetical protein